MASSELVVLKGGVSVLLSAYRLALDLETDGFQMRTRADGRLEVQPCRDLSPEQVRAIRANRDELIRIVRYDAREVA